MKRLALLSLLTLAAFVTNAQMDAKVTTGAINYDQGDYVKAIENLDLALADLTQLKSKSIPKGYYYRAKALLAYYDAVVLSKDQELFLKVMDYNLKAYESLLLAEKHDDGKWIKKIEVEYPQVSKSLLNSGMNYFNGALKATNPREKELYLSKSIEYFKGTVATNVEDYVGYDLLGQAQLTIQDTVGAEKSLNTAILKYSVRKPSTPDLLIAYAYYRVAIIARYGAKEDIDVALKNLIEGKAMLETEYTRLTTSNAWSSYTDVQKSNYTRTYEGAKTTLNNFELDIYLNSPDKMNEALAKFEKATKDEPNNYMIHIAYASLLENSNPTKSIEIYKKATLIDAKESSAFYNLGALYNNLAVVLLKKSNSETDYKKAKVHQDEANGLIGLAYENFKKVDELEPENISNLKALKQCAITLDKTDDYSKYKERLKKLGH